jgi:hypothetical protein
MTVTFGDIFDRSLSFIVYRGQCFEKLARLPPSTAASTPPSFPLYYFSYHKYLNLFTNLFRGKKTPTLGLPKCYAFDFKGTIALDEEHIPDQGNPVHRVSIASAPSSRCDRNRTCKPCRSLRISCTCQSVASTGRGGDLGQVGLAVVTSSAVTSKRVSNEAPKLVDMATSVASRPVAMSMRPMRGVLWRASTVCQ